MSARQTIRLVVALLAASALVAAACGNDDDGGEATGSAEEATEPAATEQATEPTATAEAEPTEPTEPTEDEAEATPEATGTAADPSLDPFVIGWANMDEGVIAFPSVTAGAELAVEYINAELGGVDGHPVELRVCNAGLDPESNQACAEEFVNDDSVQAISSGFLIGSAAFHPTLVPSGKPHVGGQPLTPPDWTAENTYYYYAGNPGIIGGLGVFALEYLEGPITKAAIIGQDNPGGRISVEQLRPVLEAGGVEVTTVFTDVGEADLVGPITAAGAQDADVFFPLVDQGGCIQTANAMQTLGLEVPVLTTGICADPMVTDAVAGLTTGWYVGLNGASVGPDSTDPDSQFYNGVLATHGDPEDPLLQGLATQGFANILIISEVASAIGWDALAPETLSEGFAAFGGPVLLGAPEVSCPGPEPYTTICTGLSRVYQLDEQGAATIDATDGAFVDVR